VTSGAPVADTESGRIALELTFFSGLGLVIVFLGAIALGRLSVRSLRDVRHAQRPLVEPAEPTAFGTTTTEPVTEPERRRNWRHLFGGSRRTPVAH